MSAPGAAAIARRRVFSNVLNAFPLNEPPEISNAVNDLGRFASSAEETAHRRLGMAKNNNCFIPVTTRQKILENL
jgi:hypothetical protein